MAAPIASKQEISAEDLRRRLLITLDHEVEVLEHQFARNRVHHLRGRAEFVDRNTLSIEKNDGEVVRVTATSILLAIGTRPYRPENIPFDGEKIIDSDELLEIQEIPRSMIVIGAGVIGIEYATIYSTLDTVVTVIEPRASMLDFIDKEIVEDFSYQLRDRNMKLLFGETPKRSSASRNGKCKVTLASGRSLHADMVLYAAAAPAPLPSSISTRSA